MLYRVSSGMCHLLLPCSTLYFKSSALHMLPKASLHSDSPVIKQEETEFQKD